MKQTILVTIVALLPATAWAQDAKEVYLDQCAVCHGADGAGKTAKGRKIKVKDVRETIKKVKEEDMLKIVRDGKSPDMDAYGKKLNADMVKAVTAYYRGLAK